MVVKTMLGVDVRKERKRYHNIVNAKMIYSQILHESGYGCSVIAKSMIMNHATILHYFKKFPWYIKTDVQLRNNYEKCKVEFNRVYDPIYYLTENELKKELISLRIEKEKLSSELEKLNAIVIESEIKSERLKPLFDMVEQRTRVGTEENIIHRLNQFFNGVYNR
tara:strand:+ start:442 stop:936 length:495 start_codon:yes stop_codon:yes gene_type:complete